MNFHDPARTRLANWRPCWLSSYIALPPFQLEPHRTDPSKIVLTICDGSRGIWLSTDIPLTSLIITLHYWSEDPEGAFQSIFGLPDWPRKIEKPSFNGPSPVSSTPIPIEELI